MKAEKKLSAWALLRSMLYGNTKKKIILLFVIVLAGNFFVGHTIYKYNRKLVDSARWVAHTEQVIFQSSAILSSVKDVEILSGGFIATGPEVSKQRALLLKTIRKDLVVLRLLANDNPAQQKKIDSLFSYINKYFVVLSRTEEFKRTDAAATTIQLNFLRCQECARWIRILTLSIQNGENLLLKERKSLNERRSVSFGYFTKTLFVLTTLFTILLLVLSINFFFQNIEKTKAEGELVLAKRKLLFRNDERKERAADLVVANKELVFQAEEKESRASELALANIELAFQNKEKENRSKELETANKELLYQNIEKERRAAELKIANQELAFQNSEKEKRSQELVIANKELIFQNKEKEKRGSELIIANQKLAYESSEKENRAAELIIANIELAYQNGEKERTAQARLINEEKLARAQKVAHMGSWERNYFTDVLTFSDETCRIYGFPEKTHLPFKTWSLFIHQDDREEITGMIKRNRDLLTDSSYHHRIVRNDGTIRHVYSESRFELNAEGLPRSEYGTTQDVTEIKRAEEQIEFERSNLASLINNTTDLIWSVNMSFELITSNKAFIEYANFVTGQTLLKGGDVLLTQCGSRQWNFHKANYKRAFRGETFTEIEHAGSPEFWAETSYYPIRNGGEIIGTACYSRDITDRKRAEKEREKMSNDIMQRSKNLEQFAYIISHNLRAPVAHVLGISNILKGNLSEQDREKTQEYLFQAVSQMDIVITDLNQILTTKSQITEKKEVVSFLTLVEEITSGIQNLVQKENVKITVDFSAIDKIVTLKGYLYSVFYNLILNSIKYKLPLITPVIDISSSIKEGRIMISFKDNGLGIDLDLHSKNLFGLYKRFHPAIEGKGVGLFMVRTQLEALGGTISIKSEPNKGAEFIIELPLT